MLPCFIAGVLNSVLRIIRMMDDCQSDAQKERILLLHGFLQSKRYHPCYPLSCVISFHAARMRSFSTIHSKVFCTFWGMIPVQCTQPRSASFICITRSNSRQKLEGVICPWSICSIRREMLCSCHNCSESTTPHCMFSLYAAKLEPVHTIVSIIIANKIKPAKTMSSLS